jgi:hypothetical protein
MGKVKKQW